MYEISEEGIDANSNEAYVLADKDITIANQDVYIMDLEVKIEDLEAQMASCRCGHTINVTR